MHNLRDFRPDLHGAISSLHRAGFDGEAYVLAASMEGAYGSPLEMVQAIRAAVLRVQGALGADLPGDARAALQATLDEVARVRAALILLDTAPPLAGAPAPAAQIPSLAPLSSG